MNTTPSAKGGARETLWSVLATVTLVVKVVTTLTTPVLIIGWIIVAFTSSLLNDWFVPAIVSGVLLAVSTFAYTFLRPDRGN